MPVKTIASNVTSAVQGAATKLFQAAGARLKPMIATMAPVTTGGMMMSIHLAPAKWTIAPTSASERPAHMIPKLATPISPVAAVAASTGAMKPKEEPR